MNLIKTFLALAIYSPALVHAQVPAELAPEHRNVIYDPGGNLDLRSMLGKGAGGELVLSSIPQPSDLATNETFGSSVAVGGNLVAVATSSTDLISRVFMFRREGDNYVQDGEVFATSDLTSCSPIINLAMADARLRVQGAVEAFDGTVVFISSPRDETTPDPTGFCVGSGKGIISVAAKCPNGEWTIGAQFFPDQAEAEMGFGTAVGLSDDLLAVGAPSDQQGSVRIFEIPSELEIDCDGDDFIDPTMATEVDILRPSVTAKGNSQLRFGQSLAFKRGKLAVGAPGATGSPSPGFVSLYSMIAGNLQEAGDPVQSSMAAAGDQFGQAVALEGETLAVGAPGQSSGVGMAFTYDFSSRMQSRTIDPPPGARRFGWDVDFFKRFLMISSPEFKSVAKGTAPEGALIRVDLETNMGIVTTDPSSAGLGESTESSFATVASGAPETDSGSGAAQALIDSDRLFVVGFEDL